MHIDLFDYELPESLIAQYPLKERASSRLLLVDRGSGDISHRHFSDIIDYLNEGDTLVLNNSKVIPARLLGQKKTGARVEFLLIKQLEPDIWQSMVKPGRKLKPGDIVDFAEDFQGEILDYMEDGTRKVKFTYRGIFFERLEELGSMPLPPYINRESEEDDSVRYQTVYSKFEGSVAAPTAGLHFTEALLEQIKKKGVNIAYVTLHVGIGTFRPVKVEKIEDHHMHFEMYEIREEDAKIINSTPGRVICVGTTSVRTLESAFDGNVLRAGTGETDIFIYPPYEFKVVDGLITNFHLPKSTLLMLISAFYDREKILEVYREAVDEKYRFFSYGDAMFLI